MNPDTEIILWVMGGGFTVVLVLMKTMFSTLRVDIQKLDEKITDIDRRLCRLEGAFSSNDGHVECIKQEN